MGYLSLGATPILGLPTPSQGQFQPPIYPLIVGNHGGYMEVRSSPSDGSCGVSSYPCKHPGVDVYGPQGTRVVAPESGVVMAIADGNSSPWVGYGPYLAVIRGDVSGKFHLLAHLEPSSATLALFGQHVTAGQQIGTTSNANHTHWEVRNKQIPDWQHGETNYENGIDPIAWLRKGSGPGIGTMLLLGGGALFAILMYRRSRKR